MMNVEAVDVGNESCSDVNGLNAVNKFYGVVDVEQIDERKYSDDVNKFLIDVSNGRIDVHLGRSDGRKSPDDINK